MGNPNFSILVVENFIKTRFKTNPKPLRTNYSRQSKVKHIFCGFWLLLLPSEGKGNLEGKNFQNGSLKVL